MHNSTSIIAGSIVISGAIIAGAIIFANSPANPATSGANQAAVGSAGGDSAGNPAPASGAVDNLRPVTKDDHIRGDVNAPVKIVEFSDTECPFCKRFHETMRQVLSEYDGQVAWVYRHFPLDSLHSKARKEAEATECAAELGGNEKFWAYADRIFAITPSNNGLDLAELPRIAEYVGLDRQKFDECLASGRYAQEVQKDLDDATSSGGRGTPYSIVVAKNGKKFVISGAQPVSAVKQTVERALAEK